MKSACAGYGSAGRWICVAFAMFSLLLTASAAHAVGTLAGTIITNQAGIDYHDASLNNYTATSNLVSVEVNPVFTVAVVCATPNQSQNSNTTAFYACTLTNTGNAPNTFALGAASNPTWVSGVVADDGAGTGGVANDGTHQIGELTPTATTGVLAADAIYKFFIAATVPAGTANATPSTVTLTVTGSSDTGSGDDTTTTRTTTALAPALTVAKKVHNFTTGGAFVASGVKAKPTETLEYQILVNNGGQVQAMSVVLTDNLDAHVSFVPGSFYIGPDASASNAAPNGPAKTDAAAGDTPCGAAADACGAATYTAGTPNKVTFYLGSNASESAGGTLNPLSSVYVYYKVTVN